jgi:hypothetical protein
VSWIHLFSPMDVSPGLPHDFKPIEYYYAAEEQPKTLLDEVRPWLVLFNDAQLQSIFMLSLSLKIEVQEHCKQVILDCVD